MAPAIHNSVVQDIGGDEQQVHGIDTNYYDLGLKYLLLPVWISTYKYNNKLYHFTVNACTGEVVGERPYSALKIALTVIAGILIIIGTIIAMQNH